MVELRIHSWGYCHYDSLAPAILHASQEGRIEGMRHYTVLPLDSCNPSPKVTYVNWSVDTILPVYATVITYTLISDVADSCLSIAMDTLTASVVGETSQSPLDQGQGGFGCLQKITLIDVFARDFSHKRNIMDRLENLRDASSSDFLFEMDLFSGMLDPSIIVKFGELHWSETKYYSWLR